MTRISAHDILQADRARLEAQIEPLLTDSGRRVLRNLTKIMQPMPQAEIDDILRRSLKEGSHL